MANRKHEFTSKGKTFTLGELLDWANDNLTNEDGEPKYSQDDLLCVGVLRLKALNKDNTRHGKGLLPRHFYAPRIDKLEKAPAPLEALRQETERVEGKYAPESPKPTHKPKASKPTARKVAPKASKPAPEPKPEPTPAPVVAKAPAIRKSKAPAVKLTPEPAPVVKVEPTPAPVVAKAEPRTESFTFVNGKATPVA